MSAIVFTHKLTIQRQGDGQIATAILHHPHRYLCDGEIKARLEDKGWVNVDVLSEKMFWQFRESAGIPAAAWQESWDVVTDDGTVVATWHAKGSAEHDAAMRNLGSDTTTYSVRVGQ